MRHFTMTSVSTLRSRIAIALAVGLGAWGLGASVQAAEPASEVRPAAQLQQVRVQHAKELLGKYYGKSVVRSTGQKLDPLPFIRLAVLKALPASHRGRADAVARALVDEAYRHDFDPMFLVAVVKTESSFNPSARGSAGEIGLMQIMPATGQWLAHRIGLNWKGKKTLLDPVANIRLGAAYLSFLRERFDSHSRLYLAAYNMGARNVDRALDRKVWPKEYPARVMQHYVQFYSELNRAPASAPAS